MIWLYNQHLQDKGLRPTSDWWCANFGSVELCSVPIRDIENTSCFEAPAQAFMRDVDPDLLRAPRRRSIVAAVPVPMAARTATKQRAVSELMVRKPAPEL